MLLRKSGNSTIVTIPKSVQRALGAKAGDEIEFFDTGDGVLMRKVPKAREDDLPEDADWEYQSATPETEHHFDRYVIEYSD